MTLPFDTSFSDYNLKLIRPAAPGAVTHRGS
jgi:hypothetical protein